LLGRDFIASDDIILHRVRNSLSAMKMADQRGRNIAASRKAAMLHGVQRDFLERLEYHHLFTEVLGAQWQVARKCGFFLALLWQFWVRVSLEPDAAVRASIRLRWRERHRDRSPDGGQARLRWPAVDSFFPHSS